MDEQEEDVLYEYIYEQEGHESAEENSETEDEEENGGDDYIPLVNSPRFSGNGALNSGADSVEGERIKRRRVEQGEGGVTHLLIGDENAKSSQGREWNWSDVDGLFCPICMDAWTSEGDHHICCLPCGHLFGLSCISKWLKQKRSAGKCPQCNRKCSLKDLRKLFAPRIAVVDEESRKTILSLEAKCASLEKKDADWSRKEVEWKKREAQLQAEVSQLTKRRSYLERVVIDLQSKSTTLNAAGNINPKFCSLGSSCSFVLEMNLLPPHESEDIFFPSSMKTIKCLQISPFNGGHALCASLGKKLSVLSLESNNVILSYDLPAPAWSCSWDLDSSNYLYAGLQNGNLLAFDMRQTGSPLESRLGLKNNPIHTLHSLQNKSSSGARTLLSASSIGLCQWNIGSAEERPSLVHETMNQGVCVSLAYCCSSNDIVATYRPKVEMSNEIFVTQPSLTPSPIVGKGVQGSHHYLKREGDKYNECGTAYSTVSDIRLPKSAIIDIVKQKPLFATGEECELVLQELPSFAFVHRLKPHKHLISDVKYTSPGSSGLLGCLSEDTLQLFSSKFP